VSTVGFSAKATIELSRWIRQFGVWYLSLRRE